MIRPRAGRNMMPKRGGTTSSKAVKERRGGLRMLRLALIQILGKHCQWGARYPPYDKGRCTVTDPDILQFAHVHGKENGLTGAGRGSYERLKDVFDHPDCYVLLCKDHHLEYDKEK